MTNMLHFLIFHFTWYVTFPAICDILCLLYEYIKEIDLHKQSPVNTFSE